MNRNNWIVNIKGGANQTGFEISVVRKNNTHGIKSYGWFDEDKLLISHSGGPCQTPVISLVWDYLVAIAEQVAAELNAMEKINE